MLVTLLIAATLANADDARRPFFVIAHCTNATSRVTEALAAGANGVEIDVPLRRGGLLARHGGLEPRECGARTASDDLPALFQHVAVAMDDGDLSLLIIDAKETEGQGEAYGRMLGLALTEAAIPAERAIVSVPLEQGGAVRRGLQAVAYDARLDLYLADYGVMNPDTWLAVLDEAEVDVAGVGMDPIAFWRPMSWWHPWMDAMTARRDTVEGPYFRYYWTINRAASARIVLDHGLDGLITNHPGRIVPVLDELPYRNTVRLAAATDLIP